MTWGETDGVHLDMFKLPESYDAVISNQVIEHLHRDDLAIHFRAAWRVLRPGGRYVFATPHCTQGHPTSRASSGAIGRWACTSRSTRIAS